MYKCGLCDANGLVRKVVDGKPFNVFCSCEFGRKQYSDGRMRICAEAGIPKNVVQRELWPECETFVKGVRNDKNFDGWLVLLGSFGIGKTSQLISTARRVCCVRKTSIKVIDATRFFREMMLAYNDPTTFDDYRYAFTKPDFVFVDNLFGNTPYSKSIDFTRYVDAVTTCFRIRDEEGKPLAVASNCGPTEVRDVSGTLCSRLIGKSEKHNTLAVLDDATKGVINWRERRCGNEGAYDTECDCDCV